MKIDIDKAAEELANFCWNNGMPGKNLQAEIKEILERHLNHNELSEQMPEPM